MFQHPGLLIRSSPQSPSQTVDNVKKILQTKAITLFALVDHASEAHKVGMHLAHEQLLIFGDPKIGTFLMQENPLIGIELPLKVLVWQNAEGATQIAYRDPISLGKDYGIEKNAPILKQLSEAMMRLVDQAIRA